MNAKLLRKRTLVLGEEVESSSEEWLLLLSFQS